MISRLAVVVLYNFAAAAIVCAQSGGQPGQRGYNQPLSEAPESGHVVDLKFAGGSLRDFITLLDEQTEGASNIVVSGPAERIPVDPLQLRDVHVHVALQVVTDRSFVTVNGVPYSLRYKAVASRAGGTPVHAVHVEDQRGLRAATRAGGAGGSIGAMQRAGQIEVFSLRSLLDARINPETILGAIEIALAMEVHADEAAIRFHGDSGLLIVRGTSDQVAAVERIVSELNHSVAPDVSEQSRAKGLREAEQQLRRDLARLYSEQGTPQPESEVDQKPTNNQPAPAEGDPHSRASQLQREIDRLEHILTAVIVEQHLRRLALSPPRPPSTSDDTEQ